MKNLFRIILLMTAFILLKPCTSLAGRFYVVVATFSSEEVARQFSHSLQSLFEETSFRFDPRKNLYFVHVMETGHQESAENFRNRLRDQFGFRDAWIYTSLDPANPGFEDGGNDGYVKLELHTGGSVLLSSADNSYVSLSRHQGEKKERKESAEIPAESAFIFVAETRLGRIIPAKVSLLDRKGNVLSVFKTGEAVSVGGKQDAQILTLACEVPGFNPITKVINVANPATVDITANDQGIWEVRFTLSKSNPDEVVFLHHRMFYDNAAIFDPAARKQIDVLMHALKGDPATKIVINSHCNVGEKRAIKLRGSEEGYFDLEDAVVKTGTDKLLTRERAEALRDYLVEQGIENNRITLFGWGSMNLVVSRAAENRAINDRVEVVVVGF